MGKVTKREPVLVNDSPTYRYTVKIDEYWLGITSPVITVYGEAGDSFPFGLFDRGAGITSCGFRLEKGKRFFFTPNMSQGSVLEIQLCDYAGGASGLDGRVYTEFRKVMGEPMHFDRK